MENNWDKSLWLTRIMGALNIRNTDRFEERVLGRLKAPKNQDILQNRQKLGICEKSDTGRLLDSLHKQLLEWARLKSLAADVKTQPIHIHIQIEKLYLC